MGQCAYKKIIEELSPTACGGNYCFFRNFFDLVKFDQRSLCQIKVMERYKWEKNKNYTTELSWDTITDMWIQEGYAAKFAEVYNEELTAHEIYKIMFLDK